VIYSDAPVAGPFHRFLAAALDASLMLIALGIFFVTLQFALGEIALNKQTIPLFGVAGLLVAVFYHALFILSNSDTPGMAWTHVRLLNFDGKRPDRTQRLHRMTATCLSVLAAGLGVLWALVDEEKLTWHDHMSRTFPSPRD
jgi:uncharacterized RDD family membrane protein YckC